jgi:hypothetical protein
MLNTAHDRQILFIARHTGSLFYRFDRQTGLASTVRPSALKVAGVEHDRGMPRPRTIRQDQFLSKIQLFCAGIIAYNAAHERACFSA